MMNISTDLVSAWCAIITVATLVGGAVFRHWSKRQDRAINKLESDVDRLKTHGIELRRYIRRLLFILKNHHIEYPTPPDSFYDDTIPPHMLKGMIDNE